MTRRQRKKLFRGSRTIWKNKYQPLWRKLWLEFAKNSRRRWHEKLLWVGTLRVGDTVNDCRYKNLCIEKIYEEPYDLTLILEDGASCSAMSCCSPPLTPEEIAERTCTPGS